MKILFFDTETTGVIIKGASHQFQPHIVQLGIIGGDYFFHEEGMSLKEEYDENDDLVTEKVVDELFNPGVIISKELTAIHGISNEMVKDKPIINKSLGEFIRLTKEVDLIVGHNVQFDIQMIEIEAARIWNLEDPKNRSSFIKWQIDLRKKTICTMNASIDLCKLPGKFGNYKWPKLAELHKFLFQKDFENAHNAAADIKATQDCFVELVKRKVIDISKYDGFSVKK